MVSLRLSLNVPQLQVLLLGYQLGGVRVDVRGVVYYGVVVLGQHVGVVPRGTHWVTGSEQIHLV